MGLRRVRHNWVTEQHGVNYSSKQNPLASIDSRKGEKARAASAFWFYQVWQTQVAERLLLLILFHFPWLLVFSSLDSKDGCFKPQPAMEPVVLATQGSLSPMGVPSRNQTLLFPRLFLQWTTFPSETLRGGHRDVIVPVGSLSLRPRY